MAPGIAALLVGATVVVSSGPLVLLDFEGGLDPTEIVARDGTVTLVADGEGRAMQLQTGHKEQWPGITWRVPSGKRDLSSYTHLTVEVRNTGMHPAEVVLRADGPNVAGRRVWVQQTQRVEPGRQATIRLELTRCLPEPLAEKLFGMRGFPGGMSKDKGIDPRDVDQVLLFVSRPKEEHRLVIDNLCAVGAYENPKWAGMSPEAFFPMIDRYGQFIHAEWPGKTHSDNDLVASAQAEAADLAAHPGPPDWDRFGGWNEGPTLEATGHFRVEKRAGRWWLVDPDGRLFWSHGIDCVRSSTGYTPITDREFYFADLPPRDGPFGQFYGRSSWAPHGYYQDKSYETFNFTGANLRRKYGENWPQQFAELCHRRLRSWGLNTIANWSDPAIYRLGKTPYVVTVNSGRRPIEGSTGYWGKFPDPFDPGFVRTLQRSLSDHRNAANDAWCIGIFVDNELSWGDELSLALAALASPADQPAKRAFADHLQAKYASIDRLNAAWGTQHASWQSLLESTNPPAKEKARDDLAAFYSRIAEQYFRTCRDAVKQAAPNKLYLGCRFAWVNDRAVRAAAKYCDVVSFNRYRDSADDFALPDGVDKPAIIGEFHFGALDRGMFHTGLRPVASQQERAEAYERYVSGAVRNPFLVGTHWFQFGDQATTGRGDGENYQIGFLDVCDTPYEETIGASRAIGRSMYRLRSAPAE